jgi:cytochrome c5
VSKQDTHFFNVFTMVITLLVAVTVGLFALARIVASRTQELQVFTEADYSRNVETRIHPLVQIAVAGRDNSALAIQGSAPAAGSGTAAAIPKTGTELYEQTCSVCHGQGTAGAPKAGDKAAWGPRLAQGKATLYEHALKGFQGASGVMPPKGGRTDVPDEIVKQAVDHLTRMAQ